jgi:hypothetical protein
MGRFAARTPQLGQSEIKKRWQITLNPGQPGPEKIEETIMTTASLIAESLRHRETIETVRERLSAAPVVAKYYNAIRLPALAAAASRVSERRRVRRKLGEAANAAAS